ncbi:MAG: redoxin domain-containing protein [Alphaproteobacteria bacterium]|jgi:hypothetical protein|nr:redoxin domain-containing protein [Alphaproteobacteria bacterium]MDP6517857.1 redoxin domain-containing protein [Alphaproteobacteria bacterium]
MNPSKRTLLGLGLAALGLLGMAALPISPAAAAARVGEPAPDFTGIDSNGVTHRLGALAGSVVILEWTNHGCPYVGKHYRTGNMQRIQRDAIGRGVVWLTIVSSAPGTQGHVTAGQANALTENRDAAPSAVLLDPDGVIGRLYGATVTPHMFVIDPAGAIAYMGAIDDKPSARAGDVDTAHNYVLAALDAVIAGGEVETPYARPYGCSVKYAY